MKKKLIYVVDDDPEIRDLLASALELEDFNVVNISNGINLIEELKKKKPNLILLDIMMSWIDGFDICNSIKQNPLYKDIPIIFITAYKNNKIESEIKQSLADDYIFKPFSLNDLLTMIKKHIK